MDENRKRAMWPKIVGMLVMLPVLYVLSIGPAQCLLYRLPDSVLPAYGTAYDVAYFPIIAICSRSETLSSLHDQYVNLWFKLLVY